MIYFHGRFLMKYIVCFRVAGGWGGEMEGTRLVLVLRERRLDERSLDETV